jgi:hypothetical protein
VDVKRIIALGLVLAGLTLAPAVAFAHGARSRPSVLGVPTYGGPSVLSIQQGFVRPGFQQPRHHHHPFAGHVVAPHQVVRHPQPVWVQPQWAWDGWQWVWIPGYWAW